MKFYVIYDYYTEYNQFEGFWDKEYKEFDSYQEAQKFADDEEGSIGPLILTEDVYAFYNFY